MNKRLSSLSLRFSLATAVVAALVFGTAGFFHLQKEEAELYAVATAQLELLTRSLEISAENALRDDQLADVVGHLAALEALHAEVDVFLYDRFGVEHGPARHRTSIAATVRQETATAVMADQRPILERRHDEKSHLVSATPLHDGSDPVGTLLVALPLDALERDLTNTRRNIVAIVLLFIVLSTATSLVLVELYVGRRLMTLEKALGAVRRGEFHVGVAPGHDDEVGRVIREFDRMAKDLATARTRLDDEIEARRATELAIQRADKLIAVGQLSAAVAHEIGSPLQIIAGRARSLMATTDASRIRRYARAVANQADRITRIVQTMLSLARQHSFERTVVEIEPALRDVVDLADLEARRQGVALSCRVPNDLPEIVASADQLQQLVLNLLRNSIEATPAGGTVELTVSAETREEASGLRFEVADDGSGMPEEIVRHLYEPFFTTRAGEGGNGLGLSVVESIVHEHGGTIDLETREGVGTRFTIWLPSAAESREVGHG
jgi:signal transduction histidine kinase